ncbi:hypothetical protein [Paenibacillus soyae]|uniref:Zinc-finger domain-containing protein n=1 Tax=Paenibacillus soyae TaxID=2969249 RepID=A0A9X2MXI4_9BACL|nr:hypothetical protein [Paenibacillus soyae]MCR2805287.1 hypothetical protein [Paenibacillus soyae]
MSGMDNGHLSMEQLHKYIRNELSPSEREQADQELLECEGCMWRFAAAMKEAERGELPIVPDDGLPDMFHLEERVMAELLGSSASLAERHAEQDTTALLPGQELAEAAHTKTTARPRLGDERHQLDQPQTLAQSKVPNRRGSWLQHPVTHYAIAASVTLLLVATGALAGFSEKLQHIDEADGAAARPPFSASAEWRDEPSWSDRLVHQAGSFLDGVQALRFNK